MTLREKEKGRGKIIIKGIVSWDKLHNTNYLSKKGLNRAKTLQK